MVGKTNAMSEGESLELITVVLTSQNHSSGLVLSYVDPKKKTLKTISLYTGYNQNMEMFKDSILVINDDHGYGIGFSASGGTTKIKLNGSTSLALFVSDNTTINLMDG